jgi:hypothetical protein
MSVWFVVFTDVAERAVIPQVAIGSNLTPKRSEAGPRALHMSLLATYYGTGVPHLRKCTPLGPYRRPMPRVLGGSWGGGRFLTGEVPLYGIRRGGRGMRVRVKAHNMCVGVYLLLR